MRTRRVLVSWTCALLLSIATSAMVEAETRRTADGRPDLSGTYDGSTLTPLERPPEFGDRLYLTPEQAARMVEEERALMARGDARTAGIAKRPRSGERPSSASRTGARRGRPSGPATSAPTTPSGSTAATAWS